VAVDFPYRFNIPKDSTGAYSEEFNEDCHFLLGFGTNLRTTSKLSPVDPPSKRAWGNNLVDRHMLLANNLNHYPVYNDMRVFMTLISVSNAQPISSVFKAYSYNSTSVENLGALVFNSFGLPSRFILRELAKVDGSNRNCTPSL
jgi:hypothetical protein